MRIASGVTRDRKLALQYLGSSLMELRNQLLYIEKGDNISCRTAAACLYRILHDELPKVARVRDVKMRSYAAIDPNFRTPFPLTKLEVSAHGTRIIPVILPTFGSVSFDVLPFKQWISQSVIHGLEASEFFELAPERVMTSDLSRDETVINTRNEIGSHVDHGISSFIFTASQDFTMLNLKIESRDGKPVSPTGIPPHKWTYLSATIASIGFETLKSIQVVESRGTLDFLNTPEA